MTNIAEILKNAPKGTKLYSPICGECYLKEINKYNKQIIVYVDTGEVHYSSLWFSSEGHLVNLMNEAATKDGECLLFPSKEQRNWSKFKVPYQFKPFDKVVVRDYDSQRWRVDLFSHIVPANAHNKEFYMCISTGWNQCLPYNEETAKLVGTTKDYEEL